MKMKHRPLLDQTNQLLHSYQITNADDPPPKKRLVYILLYSTIRLICSCGQLPAAGAYIFFMIAILTM